MLANVRQVSQRPMVNPQLIAAGPNAWAKILRMGVPPRQVVTPRILSFES
jgi:hypothetical protein